MFHYVNAITNTKGDALIGYYVRAVVPSTGSVAPIYSDSSSTAIETVSGVADAAKVDANGNASFYIASGEYHLDIYATDSTTKVERIENIPMVDASGASDVVASRALLAQLTPTSGRTAILNESGRFGHFVFSTANLSAEVAADTAQGLYIAPASDPTGASGAWVRKISGHVAVPWFGAIADDSTDNTTAINAAIATVQVKGGGDLFFPAGVYRVTSLTVPDGAVCNLIGEGQQSVIKTTSATADVVTVAAWYARIRNLKFMSSVTRTAGIFVKLAGAHNTCDDCHFVGDFYGIKLEGVGTKARRNVFDSGATGARRIWASGGDTSQTIEGNLMNAQAPGVDAGIFVDNSAALKIIDNDIIGQGRCLHIAPATGQSVFSLWSRGNFYDSATYGVAIEPSGTGSVRRSAFTDDWMSSHTVNGIQITANGSTIVDGIDIDGCETNLNVAGMAIAGSGATNIRVRDRIARQNSDAAMSVGNNVGKFSEHGLRAEAADGLTANAYGYFLGTGLTEYEIDGGNVAGQSVSAIAGHIPSATKTISNMKGFATLTRGTATVLNGTSSITVSHGLAGVPTRIVTVPQNDPVGRWWCEGVNRTSTQFTINQNNAAVGYNVTYDWVAYYE